MTAQKRFDTQISVPMPVKDKNDLEYFAELLQTTVSQLVRQAVKFHNQKLVQEHKDAYEAHLAQFRN